MLYDLKNGQYGILQFSVADAGFPVGGRQLPRRLRFVKFVCQNERISTLRGARAGGTPPGSATGSEKSMVIYK